MISDRIAVKQLLISTLEAAFAAATDDPDLAAVGVFFDEPGENVSEEYVAFGTITGDSEASTFGPTGSDDRFVISCGISTDGHADSEAASVRAQLILNAVNAALFTSAAGTASVGQSLNARIYPGKQDGPNADPPLDGLPACGVVELDVMCKVAVRGS